MALTDSFYGCPSVYVFHEKNYIKKYFRQNLELSTYVSISCPNIGHNIRTVFQKVSKWQIFGIKSYQFSV